MKQYDLKHLYGIVRSMVAKGYKVRTECDGEVIRENVDASNCVDAAHDCDDCHFIFEKDGRVYWMYCIAENALPGCEEEWLADYGISADRSKPNDLEQVIDKAFGWED